MVIPLKKATKNDRNPLNITFKTDRIPLTKGLQERIGTPWKRPLKKDIDPSKRPSKKDGHPFNTKPYEKDRNLLEKAIKRIGTPKNTLIP